MCSLPWVQNPPLNKQTNKQKNKNKQQQPNHLPNKQNRTYSKKACRSLLNGIEVFATKRISDCQLRYMTPFLFLSLSLSKYIMEPRLHFFVPVYM
eukprot:gene12543-8595_t